MLPGGTSTVFGVLSDGDRFVFLCLDNDSIVCVPRPPPSARLTLRQVHRSPEFDIVTHLSQILRYFRHCLSVVVTSSPTSSPQNIRVERRSHGPTGSALTDEEEIQDAPDQDYDSDDQEEYDFVGLQKRVFRFRTAEYDEEVELGRCDVVLNM